MKGRNRTPFTGMSSLVIYHEQVMVHSRSVVDFGYAFEDTGYACRFLLGKEEVTEHDSPALHSPFLNCLPSNMFLGCPQSWCFRSDVDDILLSSFDTPGASSTSSSLVIYRGHYYFEAEAKLPVIVPPVSSHQVLSPGNLNKGRHAFIDAAFEINDGINREFMAFFKESDIVMYSNPAGSGSVKKMYDVFPGIWDPLLMTDNSGSVDAAFYAPTLHKLYLLIGSSFVSYSHQTDGGTDATITFTLEEVGTVVEYFPGLPANVDGATAFGGTVYIFKDNWVYKIPENQVGLSAVYPELSYYDPESGSGFFQANHCGKTAEEWRALKSQVIQPEPATQSEWKDVEEGYSGWYLVLAVFFVLLILWLLPYMFTFCYCPRRSVQMPLDEFEQERVVPTVTEPDMIDRAVNRFYHSWRRRSAYGRLERGLEE